jgi:6-phosphogluconolactonase (cycloisomerase 2 family)
MKKHGTCGLLATFFACVTGVNLVAAQDSFHIYAPSRSTQELLVIRAEVGMAGFELKMSERAPLGFAGATICRHPKKAVLYVAPPKTQWDGRTSITTGALVRLDESGACENVDAVTFKHGYAYMSVDRTGKFLLGLNYHEGQLDVYRLKPDGSINEHVVTVDEGRRNAHCILTSPNNRFLYIPYVKQTNALFQYTFNSQTGQVLAMTPRNAGPPAGTGPRHIAYHPSLPIVYFSNEQHVGVSVYDQKSTGQLTFKQLCDVLPRSKSKDGLSASDLVITPDGKFIFSAIRGRRQNFDRLAGYRVQEDGTLKVLGLTETEGVPWGMSLSPNARYLLVSCFEGESLLGYEIASDGSLRKVGRLELPKYISDLVTY